MLDLITNLVKEKGVAKIILDYKTQMEKVFCVICDEGYDEHKCNKCRGCGEWCCSNHTMTHEINCDFE